MSAVSAWPERLVTTTPSVARQDSPDGVVLSLAGEWIVGTGPQLEAAGNSLLSLAKGAKRVILDLAGLQRMDTAGAWFMR
jgi:phospholipid/cholesterol/gamma-HCH transport system permease protein